MITSEGYKSPSTRLTGETDFRVLYDKIGTFQGFLRRRPFGRRGRRVSHLSVQLT